MSETKDQVAPINLYKKLLEIKKSVGYLQKVSQGSQYKYTGSSQVLGAVRDKMNEVGVILLIDVVDKRLHSRLDEKGRMDYFTELDALMTWVDTETGEKITLGWYGQGCDLGGEKGVGKALTYMEKYFILKQFSIPTDKDDPDAWQDKFTTPEQNAEKRAERIRTAIAAVENCTAAVQVAEIWKSNVDIQDDPGFKGAVSKVGAALKAAAAAAAIPAAETAPADPVVTEPSVVKTGEAPEAAAADQRDETIKAAIAALKKCTTIAEVTQIWQTNVAIQDDSKFKTEVSKVGTKLKKAAAAAAPSDNSTATNA